MKTRRKGCALLKEALSKGHSPSAIALAHWYLSEKKVEKALVYLERAARKGSVSDILEYAWTLRKTGGGRDREAEFSIFLALGTYTDADAAPGRRRRAATVDTRETVTGWNLRQRLAAVHQSPLTSKQRASLQEMCEDCKKVGHKRALARCHRLAQGTRPLIPRAAPSTGDFTAALNVSFSMMSHDAMAVSRPPDESFQNLHQSEALCLCCGPEYRFEQIHHAKYLFDYGEENGLTSLRWDAAIWYDVALFNGAHDDPQLASSLLHFRKAEAEKSANTPAEIAFMSVTRSGALETEDRLYASFSDGF
jgi:hypothetical protein